MSGNSDGRHVESDMPHPQSPVRGVRLAARSGLRVLVWTLAALSGLGTELDAGVFTATVEEVSYEDRTITVKIARGNKTATYDVRASAVITIDKQAATLDDIQVGQNVTVTTNVIDEVTKLVVRTEETKPAARKTTKTEAVKKAVRPPARSESKQANAAKEESLGEWPQFRGPRRDNISRETGLLSEWPEDGPALAWKTSTLGAGYSSVAFSRGRIYTMGNRGEDEYLIVLDAESGDEIWRLKTGAAFHQGHGDGPRGTPTVDGDRVYALGAHGDLVCADVEQGQLIWRINILEEFDASNITWGISESVLVDGEHVICTPGGKKATFAALDKRTGKPVWRGVVPGQPSAAYSSMIPVELKRTRQYVNFVQTGVVGMRATDGRCLWTDSTSANPTANCSSPILFEDAIFSASGYGTGGALVTLEEHGKRVDATLKYHTKQMKNHHGGMAAVDGYLYGFDEGTLTCLELSTGKVAWQNRSVGKGSLTVADGMLYLRSEQGPVALAEVDPDGYHETGRFDQPDRSDKPSWSHPVVAGGKLFLRDMETLLAFDVDAEE